MPAQATSIGDSVQEKPCERCGQPFPLTKRHPTKRFCSISCARSTLPKPGKKSCALCGREFQPTAKYPQQRFCSRRCGLKATLPPDHNARVARSTVKERADKLRGRGEGKSYPKLNGRHAHRVVAEQKLGRPLAPGEIVHHDDENKANYDPQNLVVLPSQAEHASLHFKGKPRKPKMICKRGLHRLEGDNLLIDAGGVRLCRACYIAKQEAHKAKLRAATKARKADDAC